MEIVCGVYRIVNLVNNKCYIGQSRNIHKRWINHISASRNVNNQSYDSLLYRAMRKYGQSNFKLEVLEKCDPKKLNELEIAYIKEYRSNENDYGYNLDRGGNQAPHFCKLSEVKVLEIIDLLKTTDMDSEEIGKIYDVTGRTVRGINTGEYSKVDGVKYPIREYSYSKKSKLYIRIKSVDKPRYFCCECGKQISGVSNQCFQCSQKKVKDRPSAIEIAQLVGEFGFEETGRKYGVSGSTIKKWCKSYGIPYLKNELADWLIKQPIKDVKE